MFEKLKAEFVFNFIDGARWKYIVNGLGVTLTVTFYSLLLGTFIGLIVASVRSSYDQTKEDLRPGPWRVIFKLLNALCNLYLTVIRGTPVVVQLLIGYFIVDHGQFEAGRSIGFNYLQTMRLVIIPQAFKNVLPSLANEFIALLKETAVCGYIGLMDLTKGGDVIRGRTFSAFMPLLAVALIYLLLVIVFSKLVGILERRLRRNEH